MKKDELLKEVSKRADVSATKANDVIATFCGLIVKECRDNGGEISIPQFGKFKQKVNPSRNGINPLTKKPMNVPESHTIKFTASASLKQIVDKKVGKKK